MLQSKSIGDKIAAARKRLNLSQAELAQQVSISAQAVGKWERGESMPDISTLNRLAELLGVDLNYFSENFPSANADMPTVETLPEQPAGSLAGAAQQKRNWDMSRLNLQDSDCSGLKNLHEKFGSSNILRCLFVGSDLSGLLLSSNNIESCDFSDSDLHNSQIQNSNLDKSVFKNCLLRETQFSKSNIDNCDFAHADFFQAIFRYSNFGKCNLANAIWKGTSFVEMQLQDVIFEGSLDGCSFENCTFYNVKFQQATLTNTFFKNNKRFKRVQFIDCKVDKITYAFLKSNLADLSGVSLLD
jgi:uncharacterized protein YjbI with pentapeptide repeats